MLPFQSNLSQYIAEQYASTSYYQPYFVYPNQESCWNAFSYADPPAPASSLAYYDHDLPQKTEEPTKTHTKPKRPREKPNQESSASCQSAEESSDHSPDFKSRQKYGRNISSNIFHQMLKVIRSEEPFEELLDRLLAKESFEITKKQFQDILHKRLSKLNPYVSNAKMDYFLNGVSKVRMPQSREMSRVEGEFLRLLRVLCRYYLTNVHLLYVFNKLKLQRQSKEYHIQEMRKILRVLIK
jgi:hypothetical protein